MSQTMHASPLDAARRVRTVKRLRSAQWATKSHVRHRSVGHVSILFIDNLSLYTDYILERLQACRRYKMILIV